jgi:Zn-dependent protease with chaperone function
MDFFDRQNYARRQTMRLLVMFALAVVVIILTIYLVVALFAGHAGAHRSFDEAAPTIWNPLLFAWVSVGTLLVIGLSSLYKISELSAGGETVASMLGGRPVNPQTQDLAERRLLNVVEEMALASGVPVPPVYVLEREPGINAFAAGHQPGDAVVAVSAGCLKYLNREELQGVLGHEFSHILNGDMRLNLRLIGIVYGILVLAVIGYYVMRSAGFISSGNSRRDQGGAAMGAFLLGLTLVVLGGLGVFLGKLIKSAVSRQREFLADASSVQFTRNPGGLAGALKKIGGLAEGSRIRDVHAEEISHMFFGDAFAGSVFNLFATHPPLAERIRLLEPGFDGRFPEVQPAAVGVDEVGKRPARIGMGVLPGLPSRAAAAPVPPAAAAASMALDGRSVVRQIGAPQTEHLRHAGAMVEQIPQTLLDAAREPFLAQAVIYLLLLSRDDKATWTRQAQLLEAQLAGPLYRQMQQLAPAILELPAASRLPLADLTIPALKKCSAAQYGQFRQVVEALVAADGHVDLFEYCLRTVLLGYLDVHFGLKPRPAPRYRSVGAVAQPAAVVLSLLAYVGQQEPAAVQRAFACGAAKLFPQATILPRTQCTLEALDGALTELAQAVPEVKRVVIDAVTACIAADGKVTIEESELLRAIAARLACPIPPIHFA